VKHPTEWVTLLPKTLTTNELSLINNQL